MRNLTDQSSLQAVTTVERDALQPQAALVVYNTTTSEFQRWDTATRAWTTIVADEDADRGWADDFIEGPSSTGMLDFAVWADTTGTTLDSAGVGVSEIVKPNYVFDDVTERDAFFASYPRLLATDTLIIIKDTTPPPTPGTRSLDFSKAYNSQYFTLLYP